MAAMTKPRFFVRKILTKAKSGRKYRKYTVRARELTDNGPPDLCQQTRRYKAVVQAGRELFGEKFIANIEGQWARYRSRASQLRRENRRWWLERRLTLGEEALLAQIEKERARDRQLAAAEKAAKELHRIAVRADLIKIRIEKHRLKKLEAKADASEARIAYYKERKRIMEQEQQKQEAIALEKQHALQQVQFDPADSGPVDILRDTRWVYENIAQLILVSDNGVQKLNPQLMAVAPSNGARAIAMYALADHTKFMEKFAIKLFPKDIEKDVDLAGERKAQQEKLDPSLGELESYFDQA